MAKITPHPVFSSLHPAGTAGTSFTSDKIDLRHIANQQKFALYTNISVGTASTCGTTVFSYLGCPTESGTYIAPSTAVAIGTCGTAGADIMTFTPPLMPFMKIVATQAEGDDSVVDCLLIVQ